MRDKDLIRLPGERDVYEVVGGSSKLLVNRTRQLRERIDVLERELAQVHDQYRVLVDACPRGRVTRIHVMAAS